MLSIRLTYLGAERTCRLVDETQRLCYRPPRVRIETQDLIQRSFRSDQNGEEHHQCLHTHLVKHQKYLDDCLQAKRQNKILSLKTDKSNFQRTWIMSFIGA